MRDILIVLIFVVGLLYAFRSPFIGLMVYLWISVMNPHRYAWGFAHDMPLAMVAAVVTIASIALHLDQVRFPRTRETYLFFAIWVWITLTTVFAFYPDDAWVVWELVTKIFVMVFASMLLINTRARLVYYVIGLVGYVGFLSVKGAIFGILTRGQFRVWGPESSFLADNNSAAVAMVIILPFCFFLRGVVTQRWLSWALLCVGLCSIVSILLTYSRGGLLGLAAVSALSLRYARRKFRIAIAATILVIIGLSVLPPGWMERMSTIGEHQEDRSANMRLNSWAMAVNLAKSNPLGGGFVCFTMDQYYLYAPDPELGRRNDGGATTAHSIYFEVLAMHGFAGLAIFLSCLFAILLSMRRVQLVAIESGGQEDAVVLSRALTISVLGYMVGGAFLSLAFFDLFWSVFAVAVCLKRMVLAGEWKQDTPAEAAVPTPSPRNRAATVRTLASGSWRPEVPAKPGLET